MGTPRTMGTASCGRLLLPLLLPLLPVLANAKILSYQQAVQQAVDHVNQRSTNTNLFRLFSLDSQPPRDEDPYGLKRVSFTVKETVCPRETPRLLEHCDFKKDGLVMRCSGTVTLDRASSTSDISCDRVVHTPRAVSLGDRLLEGAKKLGEKVKNIGKKIGKKIKDFFHL